MQLSPLNRPEDIVIIGLIVKVIRRVTLVITGGQYSTTHSVLTLRFKLKLDLNLTKVRTFSCS